MNCEASRELLIEYSLGQLDASRTTEVRSHLGEGCHVCAEKLREIEETWTGFAASLEPVKPSPAVEQKLLAMIRGQVAPPAELPAERVSSTQQSRLAAFVLAASLVGIAAGVLAWRFAPVGEQNLAVAPAEEWGTPSSQPEGTGFQTVALQPIAEKQGVHLSVVMNQAADQWHVIGMGLPDIADGEFYQFWLETKAGAFKHAAKLPVDKNGKGGVIVDLSDTERAELASVWLTREDSATSQRPSDIVLFHAAVK
ncbi:MAG: hypothetical protein SH868_13970 [Bythopirellula sp.]|nr:hypothetical protein [Bythopirellula sp.]